ncbi:defect at low temperature protein 1 [Trichomonascus vanleenenianus]|uniref:Dlt1p n=1 Tax=Trichomonascus vanleenenianus TaxID=2268995 RepID=UPI003ECAB282
MGLFRRRSPPRLPNWNRNTAFYKVSLVVFTAIFVGLLVVSPIDTILQSQTSGQFWNVIIIVVAYALTVVIAALLYIVRVVKTRKALSDIPRRSIPHADDISKNSAELISSEIERCKDIVEKTYPTELISHPGKMNPRIAGSFDAPYEHVVETMVAFIEFKATSVDPSFARRNGMPLRDYLLWLESYGIIYSANGTKTIGAFVKIYEQVRFSGGLITEVQFNDFVENCFRVLFSIKSPREPNNNNNLLTTIPTNDGTSSGMESFSDFMLSRENTNNNAFLNPFSEPLALTSETRPPMSRQITSSTAISPFETARSRSLSLVQSSRYSMHQDDESVSDRSGSVIIRRRNSNDND